MLENDHRIPAGAKALPDLPATKDVDAALSLWRSGASEDLVLAVGGDAALEAIERERAENAPAADPAEIA